MKQIILAILLTTAVTAAAQTPLALIYGSDAAQVDKTELVQFQGKNIIVQRIRKADGPDGYLRVFEYNDRSGIFSLIYEHVESKYRYWGLQSHLYKDSLLVIFTFQLECDVPRSSYITTYDGQSFKQYDAFQLNINRDQGHFLRPVKKDELQIITTGSRVIQFIVNDQNDTITIDSIYQSENLSWRSSYFVELGDTIYYLLDGKILASDLFDFNTLYFELDKSLDMLTPVTINDELLLAGIAKDSLFIFDDGLNILRSSKLDFTPESTNTYSGNTFFFAQNNNHLQAIMITDTLIRIDRDLPKGLIVEGLAFISNDIYLYGYQVYNNTNTQYGSPRLPYIWKRQNGDVIADDYDIGISNMTYDSVSGFSCGSSPASGSSFSIYNARVSVQNKGVKPISTFQLLLNYGTDGFCSTGISYSNDIDVNLLPGDSTDIFIDKILIRCSPGFNYERTFCFYAVLPDGAHLDNNIQDNATCVQVTIPRDTVSTINPILHSIKLYPNPASDHIQILLPEGPVNINYDICNIQGQVVYSNKLLGNSSSINTQGWKPGIYLIKLNTGDRIYTKKIMIH